MRIPLLAICSGFDIVGGCWRSTVGRRALIGNVVLVVILLGRRVEERLLKVHSDGQKVRSNSVSSD